MLEQGALSVLLSYPRLLPLIGLGCALGFASRWEAAVAAALGIVGLWLGFAFRDALINAALSGPAATARLGLPSPISCLFVGLALASPQRLRSWLLPPAAMVAGAMLAVAVKLSDPSFHDPDYVRGAIGAAAWSVAAVGLTINAGRRPWLGIATRILGSWLIAIGLMLGASLLVSRPSVGATLPVPAARLEEGRSPDTFAEPRDTARVRSRLLEPELDPAAR
jgi:hypothetical protein